MAECLWVGGCNSSVNSVKSINFKNLSGVITKKFAVYKESRFGIPVTAKPSSPLFVESSS